MEIKKALLNKLFLFGLLTGVFLTICFIEGMEYGKKVALEEKAQVNSVKQESVN